MARNAGESTRVRILNAAQALVLKNGFTATSIEEIVANAGITKGTFFYHFATKADLAKDLLNRYARADVELIDELLARAERVSSDPLQQVLTMLTLLQERAEARTEPHPGCVLASCIYESSQFEPEIIGVVAETMLTMRKQIAAKLRQAVALHPPRVDVHVNSLADLFTVILEGVCVVSRTLQDSRTYAQQLFHLRTYIELLFTTSPAAPPQAAGTAPALT